MAMKQLTGLDASFLYMETPETPMHVAGLMLYELPKGFEGSFHPHFVDFFKTREHLAPIFRKRLARTVLDLDHPGWIEVDDIDLDYHIRAVSLPRPGRWDQLEAAVAEMHGQALDRKKPLWQFAVIEGLEDGRVALYAKVHHAAVDGGAGMVIAQAFYDFSPTPRQVPPPPPKAPAPPKPSVAERALLGINDLIASSIRQQLNLMQAVPQAMLTVTNLIAPPRAPAQPAAEGAAAPRRKGGLPALPEVPQVLAPKTPFNVTITARRSYAARSLSLNQAKAIRKATNTKLNDVVMAICSGALRRYLNGRKALPKQALIAFVPISLREMGNTDINNQVFGMNCPLATDVADPLERLMAIHRTTNRSKMFAGATKDIAPKDFTLLGAPLLLPGLMQLYGKTGLADLVPQAVNLVISNTPGPPFAMYCAGARVSALYPCSIPVHGIALNMTVQSYMDQLDFGLTADQRAVPDIDVLADHLQAAADELTKAVGKMLAAKEARAAEKAPEKPAKGA
jgi:WS/DGAT/MGAT family acyltransferase